MCLIQYIMRPQNKPEDKLSNKLDHVNGKNRKEERATVMRT